MEAFAWSWYRDGWAQCSTGLPLVGSRRPAILWCDWPQQATNTRRPSQKPSASWSRRGLLISTSPRHRE
jgi:hypothetical protein